MSARRLLVMGGIALVAAGMILGDLFAVFVLHQNGDRIGERLIAVAHAVAAGDATVVTSDFQSIGGLLENRGTKVDAHVHMIDFGYLALLLALAQPCVALSERRKRFFASLFLWGAVLLPVGVFCIHYVGLAHSPFQAIGWASVVADFGGFLALFAVVGEATGFLRWIGAGGSREANPLLADQSWCTRALLTGGTVLVLVGFLHGAWYAGRDLYRIERSEKAALSSLMTSAAHKNIAVAESSVAWYGNLQASKAVKIAAHSHIIEFGLLAMLLAFIQPYVMLSEAWRRRWVTVLLAGSVILPLFVLLELRFGLLAGGIADAGGALVVLGLLGMLTGVVRYTGRLDAGART